MSSPGKYKIGSEIITKHEEALMRELPSLYPDETEREIVEHVLIPQFRAMVQQVLEEFAGENGKVVADLVAPMDMPVLCGRVDEMIIENKVLLDVDGLFKPVLERIHEVRGEVANDLAEEFMQKCRDILAEKGIKGRFDLLAKGSKWFQREPFGSIGKGKAFAQIVLGKSIRRVTTTILEKIADRLFLEVSESDLHDKCRGILKEKGVTDRFELLAKGTQWFMKQSFDPFGMGTAFASRILGKKTNKKVSALVFQEIADKLFPELSENALFVKYRKILLEKGINDRVTLLVKGPKWFQKQSFDPFGMGTAFASRILGKNVVQITTSILEEIADKLFPEISENELLDKYRQILLDKGIKDHFDLITKRTKWFIREPFDPFGKGTAFASRILGRPYNKISTAILEEIANILFPISENALLDKYREVLHEKGIDDRFEILAKGLNWFARQNFHPFGQGRAFASRILGNSFGHHVSLSILEEIADILFPKE